jgi:hypothetical protein
MRRYVSRAKTILQQSVAWRRSRLTVIVVVAFFSKCLLGGLVIFMMADNTEKRGCVKFCFQSGSEQSLTENKTSRTLFFSVLPVIIKIVKPPSRYLEKKPQQQ